MGFKTYQEAYDKTVEHLNKQGSRAMDKDMVNCLYKTETGFTCAIGCHLPEGEHMDFDGSVYGLLEEYSILKNVLLIDGESQSAYVDFWVRMQEIHDNSCSTQAINMSLYDLAGTYELNAKEVTAWEG